MLKSVSKILIVFCVLFLNVSLFAESGVNSQTPCEKVEAQLVLLKKEIPLQEARLTNLKKLSEVGPQTGISIRSLLEIDLLDNEAVTQKIKSLKDTLPKPPLDTLSQDQDSYLGTQCPTAVEEQLQQKDVLQNIKAESAKLTLALLELPRDKRENLIALEKTVNDSGGQIRELEKTEKELGEKQEEAAKSLSEAQETLESTSDDLLKQLASERIILESFRKALAEKQENAVIKLKNQAEERSQLSERISGYKETLSEAPVDQRALINTYHQLLGDWRKTVDTSTSILSLLKTHTIELPPLPKYPDELLKTLHDDAAAADYIAIYDKEVSGLEQFKTDEQARLTERLMARDILLRDITQLRSMYIAKLQLLGEDSAFQWGQDFFADVGRELKLVSYKFGFFLIATIKTVDGYASNLEKISLDQKINLVKSSAHFFWLIIYASLFIIVLRKHQSWINIVVARLSDRREYSVLDKFFLYLRRYDKLLPPLLLFVGLKLLEWQLSAAVLEEAQVVLPYLYYLVAYRFFLVFFEMLLGLLSGRATYANADIRMKAKRSGVWLGRFFLTIFIIKRVTEQSVGKAIIYSYVQTSLWLFYILIFMIVAFFWRTELRAVLKEGKTLPLPHRFRSILDGPLAIFMCLPISIIFAIIQAYSLLSNWVSRLEHFRRLSALIFKRQLQKKMEHDETPRRSELLPSEYSKLFSLVPVENDNYWVKTDAELEMSISNLISDWEKDDGLVTTAAIYGEKGVGKSSLGIHLQERFASLPILAVAVPPKVVSESGLISFISGIFGWGTDSTLDDLIKRLAELPKKTVVVLDECQNLFLGRLGGFQGYDAFISLLNKCSKNVFWCAFFNSYSWRFLNEVTGRNHFFRRIFEMPSWSEEKIRELIMKRHETSGYNLDFQKIGLPAYQVNSDDDLSSEIELKFFRLLWDHSRGNPRVALDTWLKSLSLSSTSDRTLVVNLFETKSLQSLDGLSDEVHFVLAAIAKHENLTLHESVEVTSLTTSVCDYSLSMARELGMLSLDVNGRHRLTPQWQYPVINYLRKKNFIYGD